MTTLCLMFQETHCLQDGSLPLPFPAAVHKGSVDPYPALSFGCCHPGLFVVLIYISPMIYDLDELGHLFFFFKVGSMPNKGLELTTLSSRLASFTD